MLHLGEESIVRIIGTMPLQIPLPSEARPSTAVLSLTNGLIEAYNYDCDQVIASPPRFTTPGNLYDVTRVTQQRMSKGVSTDRRVERSDYQLQHSYKNKEITFLECPVYIQEHTFPKVLAVFIRSVRRRPSLWVLSNKVAFPC